MSTERAPYQPGTATIESGRYLVYPKARARREVLQAYNADRYIPAAWNEYGVMYPTSGDGANTPGCAQSASHLHTLKYARLSDESSAPDCDAGCRWRRWLGGRL